MEADAYLLISLQMGQRIRRRFFRKHPQSHPLEPNNKPSLLQYLVFEPSLINLIINHNSALPKERQSPSMKNKLISKL